MPTLAAAFMPLLAGFLPFQEPAPKPEEPALSAEQIATAGRVIGLDFTPEELKLLRPGVSESLKSFERLQKLPLPNGLAPAFRFTPLVPGIQLRMKRLPAADPRLPEIERPADLEDLAFASIPELAALIRARKVSCLELARMYLARLKRLDSQLHCVITFTEERALAQASRLDQELDEGKYRGLLHGIPWGAKDLLAVRGYPTTWGAEPFKDQVIDLDAAVVERLDKAGAVLIAKLTLGALAWGDVWYGGKTRNPWKPEQGSSGSSAGPASATAAGAVAFSIGSETLGSIVSPSTRCGCSSLRPTFGRVSRYGAMALSWTMDKLGPLCRSAGDAAIVFRAIQGKDARDIHSAGFPFEIPAPADLHGWRIGVPKEAFKRFPKDKHVLDELKALGAEIVEVELPDYPANDLTLILSCEAACAFDGLTRSGRDDLMVRQIEQAWPNVFRTARLVPAVEYLRAMRLRTDLMRAMDHSMQGIVALVHPSFASGVLTITNLTGHPTVVVPCGFNDDGTPRSISFTGQLYGEERLLALAQAWQASTAYNKKHPDL